MKSLKWLGVSMAALALVACESSEEKAVKFTENAQEYLEEGEIARARLQFENALQNDPNNVAALRGAARVAEMEERYADQLRYLQRLINNKPGDIEALAKLARLNLLSGNPDDALRRAGQVLETQPDNLEALTVQGAALVLQNDLEGASDALERALAQAPDNAEVRNLLAARYVRDEDFNRAQQIIDEGLAEDPENEALLVVKLLLSQRSRDAEGMDETFQSLIAARPQNAFYRDRYAEFLIARGEFDAAETQLREALPLLEDRSQAIGRLIGIVREREGDEAAEAELRQLVASFEDDDLVFAIPAYLCETGQTDRCETELVSISENEELPADVRQRAQVQLAERAFSRQEFEEASTLIEEVLAEDETNPDALTVRGKIELAQNEVEPAIETLREALAAEPDKEQALILLGLAYEANDRGSFAEAQLAQAIDRIGMSPALFQAYRGILLRNGKTEDAADLTLRFAQSGEATPQIQREGAAVLLGQQRPEEAEVVARSLLRQDPEDLAARRILSTSLLQQRRPEDALAVLEAGDMETDPATLRIRNQALTALGRTDELRTYLSEAIDAGGNPEAYALLTQLEINEDNPARAADVAQSFVDANPGLEAAYLNLYNARQAQARPEEAAQAIERGIESAETTANLRLLKVNNLLRDDQRQEALDVLLTLRDDNALNDLSANNLAALLLDLRDDPEAALEIAKRFSDTENPFFADTLAWAYYRTGDLENAERYSRIAARTQQPNAEIFYHRGVIAAETGDTTAARDAFERALEAPGKTDAVSEEAIRTALADLEE